MFRLVGAAVVASIVFACAVTWALDIQTRPGRIITGILLFDVCMKAFVLLLLLIDRRDSQVFLKGANELLGWAKDARNSAEHRAGMAVSRAIGEVKQEAARIAEAAEVVKLVAGDGVATPKPPARETT